MPYVQSDPCLLMGKLMINQLLGTPFSDTRTQPDGPVEIIRWLRRIYYQQIASGLTVARNPPNSMRDCNLLCCFHACFSLTASMQNIDITCVSWRFALTWDGAKITFWSVSYTVDILRNLQCFEPLIETSTNRKTLKEHQNNLTLNKP